MHYPFSVIALRRDQRTEGRETRKESTPTGPGRDAIAKSVMVYTAAPPDYCDNDVEMSLQEASSGVNSSEKERDWLRTENQLLLPLRHESACHNRLTRSLSSCEYAMVGS